MCNNAASSLCQGSQGEAGTPGLKGSKVSLADVVQTVVYISDPR